eukprot:6551585-Pyramimonas_sp.AAC.1
MRSPNVVHDGSGIHSLKVRASSGETFGRIDASQRKERGRRRFAAGVFDLGQGGPSRKRPRAPHGTAPLATYPRAWAPARLQAPSLERQLERQQ